MGLMLRMYVTYPIANHFGPTPQRISGSRDISAPHFAACVVQGRSPVSTFTLDIKLAPNYFVR